MKKFSVIAVFDALVWRAWVNDEEVKLMLDRGYTVIRPSTDQIPVIMEGQVLWSDIADGESK